MDSQEVYDGMQWGRNSGQIGPHLSLFAEQHRKKHTTFPVFFSKDRVSTFGVAALERAHPRLQPAPSQLATRIAEQKGELGRGLEVILEHFGTQCAKRELSHKKWCVGGIITPLSRDCAK
jgi:hypothetical protein